VTGSNQPNKDKNSEDDFIRDWRDPSKPRNPEDDLIVDGWRRRADGTFEKVEKKDEQDEEEQ
jgi:hypothetical protein